MKWKREWRVFLVMGGIFAAAFFVPVGTPRFDNALIEAVLLLKSYAREHVVLCLLPAFFIAGAISVFVRKGSVMKYLGARANKALAYGVASVSGSILAVCSCTVLPLFAGIYRMGAGLGPATAFLYSGPAINVLAIILTARVLGPELGIARAVGAVLFSVVIGLSMHLVFRKEELARGAPDAVIPEDDTTRPLWQTGAHVSLMVGILVFANWSGGAGSGGWQSVFAHKWIVTSVLAVAFGGALVAWFHLPLWKVAAAAVAPAVLAFALPDAPILAFGSGIVGLSVVAATSRGEGEEWFESTWGFAKQILPLLFAGVLVAGFLLGRPAHEGIIPSHWVTAAVGGNSLRANLFASVAGAFMYFATLTEVPILQGLIGSGMGKGPALALLLAGPALSLPNMLVIRSVMGTRKTVVYVALVVSMATLSGIIYGWIRP